MMSKETGLPWVHYETDMGALPFDVEFDAERYAHFLNSQGASPEQVDNLHVVFARKRFASDFTSKMMLKPSVQSTWLGYYANSANRIQLNVYNEWDHRTSETALTATLLHETKHFLDTVVEGRKPVYNKIPQYIGRGALFAAGALTLHTVDHPTALHVAEVGVILAANHPVKHLAWKALYKRSLFEKSAERFAHNPQHWQNLGQVFSITSAEYGRRDTRDYTEQTERIMHIADT